MCEPIKEEKKDEPCQNKGTSVCSGSCKQKDPKVIKVGTIGHHYDDVFRPTVFTK